MADLSFELNEDTKTKARTIKESDAVVFEKYVDAVEHLLEFTDKISVKVQDYPLKQPYDFEPYGLVASASPRWEMGTINISILDAEDKSLGVVDFKSVPKSILKELLPGLDGLFRGVEGKVATQFSELAVS